MLSQKFFFIKSILYAKLMLSQKFWINYRPFTSVALCTPTLHQQWLHTRACYKNHRPATIMVISLSLRFVDQISTSVRFWPKMWNAETLKAIVSKTAPLAKLPPGGFLFIHEIWRFHTKCRIFLGIELSSFKIYM